MDEEKKSTAGASANKKASSSSHPFKLIRNDYYLTICCYAFILVVICTVAIKMIFSYDATKAHIASFFRAISPFLIAILIAYILTPFVRTVDRLLKKAFKNITDSVSMIIAMLIVYIGAIALMIALFFWVVPEVFRNLAELVNFIPTTYSQVEDLLAKLQERFPQADLHGLFDVVENAESNLTNTLQDFSKNVLPVVYNASISVVSWFVNLIVAIVASVYMLYGKGSMKRMVKVFVHSFFSEEHYSGIVDVLRDCSHIFSKFVVSKMVDSLIIGIICFVLMNILNLPYALLISIFVGITNMIPYFGPFIGAIPGLIIELAVSPFKALTFLIMILCLQQFDGLFLGPKLMGGSIGIKPIWIIIAVTLGGRFFGVAGMFLGVPVMAIILYFADRIARHQLSKKGMKLEDIS